MDEVAVDRRLAMKELRRQKRWAGNRTPMLCCECGRRFGKTIGKNTYEVECPRCGSYDTEVC